MCFLCSAELWLLLSTIMCDYQAPDIFNHLDITLSLSRKENAILTSIPSQANLASKSILAGVHGWLMFLLESALVSISLVGLCDTQT